MSVVGRSVRAPVRSATGAASDTASTGSWAPSRAFLPVVLGAALPVAVLAACPSASLAQADGADADLVGTAANAGEGTNGGPDDGSSGGGTEGESGAVAETVASGPAAVVQPARAFGRMLGDVLTQRVPLGTADLPRPDALPAEGRVDVWFARLPTRVVRDADGTGHVELRYQIVNSPEAATVTSLPATALALADGRRIEVPPWPVSIAPLVPTMGDPTAGVPAARTPIPDDTASPAADALPPLLPDRLLPPLDTAPLVLRARLCALALALVLLAWGGWWLRRRRRDAVRLPFARAVAELRALGGRGARGRGSRHSRGGESGTGHRIGGDGRDADALAWRAVHRALDATAGRVHHPAETDLLLARAPWLAPFRERLAAFHDASSGRFFEQPPRVEPFDLHGFARELRRAERRQAR